MSGYYGFPQNIDYSAQQSAMVPAAPVPGTGYPMLAQMPLGQAPMPPTMPAGVAPVQATVPYIPTAAYPNVYAVQEPVQPMAYGLTQQQQQLQHQVQPMFQQQTPIYQQPQLALPPAMPPQPPLPMQQQLQQPPSWQPTVQPPATSGLSNVGYHSVNQHAASVQRPSVHQRQFRPPMQLLLHGDLATQLVLLCSAWPTKDLRDRVVQLLPDWLESEAGASESSGGEEGQQRRKIEVRLDEEEGCILVAGSIDADSSCLELTCSIYLTSPAVREEAGDNPQPDDALDRDKCLEALASLRQAKWFQAKASSLQSCVPVIRVLRDMCQRLPIWAPLPEWAMELIVERSISSASGSGQSMLSPGESVRRVMECLASGILLPSGPGLRDPCEKAPVDAAASMTAQEREDVTASAQQALRLIAVRQLHKVLDMEPLVPPPSAAAPAAGVEVVNKPTSAANLKRPAATASANSSGQAAPSKLARVA